jgi:xylulokinase
LGAQPVKLRLVDDEARSALWNQIKADVTGVTIETLRTPYAAALGAAILAALASGAYPSAQEAVAAMVAAERQFEPDKASFDRYAAIRARYERVYAHLDPAFREDVSAGDLSGALPEKATREP